MKYEVNFINGKPEKGLFCHSLLKKEGMRNKMGYDASERVFEKGVGVSL